VSKVKIKRNPNLLERLMGVKAKENVTTPKPEPIVLQPALRQIGITDCPVCKREVAVYLTKTQRPFINCGFCSVRIFYNRRESMRRLKRKMTEVDE
jgi:DNA-directed RNA polymerase subunit RPC12/RpoP